MAVATRTVTFRDYRNAVDGQIHGGLTFGQVEDFINACEIDEEHKAALWLWALQQQPRELRRTFVDAEVLGLRQD
jgi:hypothetical protein